MRPPVDDIPAPEFARDTVWAGSELLTMAGLRGAPVLVEFWDFCRPHSLRTLPYLREWNRRYERLTVIGAHCSGFRPSANEDAVREAVRRLGIEYPVLIDNAFGLWHEYENGGWPARYLWDADGMLAHFHFGEGAYEETEREICALLGAECEPMVALRPEDAPGAVVEPCSEDRLEEPWSGPYEAGGVWGVFEGRGTVEANGVAVQVQGPGAYELIAGERHHAGELELELGAGVRCFGVCFTPGLAAESPSAA